MNDFEKNRYIFNDFILYHGECTICEGIWTNHGLNESGLVEYDKIDEDINKMTPGDVLMECLLRVEWVVFCTSNINDTDMNSLVYLNTFPQKKGSNWILLYSDIKRENCFSINDITPRFD